MDSKNLKNASVVLLETNGEIRRLVKSALLGFGFGFVHDCRTVYAARDAAVADDASPDLFVLDLDSDKHAVCELITDLRHSRLGENPFVLIIGMTLFPEEPVIQFVLDAGTDDLIAKPISNKVLYERIVYLSENRKEFLATAGYLGPKRAKGVRNDDDVAAQVKVPNSLKTKMSGRALSPTEVFEVKRAALSFTLQRLYSIVLPIISISHSIETADPVAVRGNRFSQDIARLSDLVREIKAIDLPDTVRDLSNLTESLDDLIEQLSREPTPSPHRFEMVRLHAQAIEATMRGDHDGSTEVVKAFGEAISVAP